MYAKGGRRQGAKGHRPVAPYSPTNARVVSIRAVPRGVAVSGGRFRAREQEVVVRVELVLRLPAEDDLELKLSDRESYLSAPDIRGTEANRQLALQRVWERIAVEGIERISRGF